MAPLLSSLLRPEPLLFLIAVALALWVPLERSRPEFVLLAPIGAGLAGLLVAWPLKRSRLVFAVAALALVSQLLARWAPADPVALQVAAVLLPLTLATVALLPERGVFTPAGAWMWTALAIESVITYMMVDLAARDLAPAGLVRALQPEGLPFTPVGPLGLAAFGLAGALIALGRWFAPDTTGRGYGWAQGAVLLAFHSGTDAVDRAVFLTAAAAIPTVAAIQASYVLAYHDGLTGLPGRRALDDALARLSDTYTVAMVDVDHFKQFNDTYGHDVGDQVLRTVAARLREVLGDGRVFRYGGEEFAVLLPGQPLSDSVPLLERARSAVALEPFAVRARV
ncbi:MAG TPA: GGDEF domain-containing protein, partial [Gemmatimonadales bacterium]|nr:GGDEF domain-containing protein [Gemmatimonadales bacterium]